MSESTIRFKKSVGFTHLRNDLLRDQRLSLRTKGLFAVMASLPPNWDFSVRGLAKITGVCKDTIVAALKKMRDAGYLKIYKQKSEDGPLGGRIYEIDPMPSADCASSPCPTFSDTVEEATSPCPTFPDTEKPDTGKSPQLNKDLSKERSNNTPYSPPAGDGVRRHRSPKSVPAWKPERFEGLWNFYPDKGKKDRAAAVREWDRLKPDDELIDLIARRLAKQKASDEWQRGIGIPYLCRYLSHQRWKDTVSLAPEPARPGWAEDREVM